MQAREWMRMIGQTLAQMFLHRDIEKGGTNVEWKTARGKKLVSGKGGSAYLIVSICSAYCRVTEDLILPHTAK